MPNYIDLHKESITTINNTIDFLEQKIQFKALHDDDIKAALILSDSSEVFLHLIVKTITTGNWQASVQLSRAVALYYPNCYHIHNILGIVLKNTNRYEEAITALNKAILINPKAAMAWTNMANLMLLTDDHETALNFFTKAIKHHPNNHELLRLQAGIYLKTANPEAISILLKANDLKPNDITIILDLAAAYHNNKDYSKAIEYIDSQLKTYPNDLKLMNRKSLALMRVDKETEAIEIFEKILLLSPDDIDAICTLGSLYLRAYKNIDACKRYYQWAYNLDSDNFRAISGLCSVLSLYETTGEDLDKAHALCEKLIKITKSLKEISEVIQRIALRTIDHPLYAMVGSFNELNKHWGENGLNIPLVFQMSQVSSMNDRKSLLEVHRIRGLKLEEEVAITPITRKVRQRLNNKTRLGILSVNFKNNHIGIFIWNLLRYIDKNKFEIYCYAVSGHNHDLLESKFMAHADSFQFFNSTDYTSIAQAIANDSLDILIEVSAWCKNYYMKAIASRPADMIVSWLDYPHSIGLPTTLDYIVTDPYIKPDEPSLLIEKQLVMPNTWVSTNAEYYGFLEIDKSLPQDRNGHITFGTMNSVQKLTPQTFKIWAEIMLQFPNSRFLYVRPEASSVVMRNNFCKYMNAFGITNDRLSFVSTKTEHLKYYNEIDIAFDTFPHTGGTTTCEALWMGVPVVSLVGPMFFERISYSNLINCGLRDLCAFEIEQYKNIATSLALNKERRKYLCCNLRKQILNSPLGRPQEFTTDFTTTLLHAWSK